MPVLYEQPYHHNLSTTVIDIPPKTLETKEESNLMDAFPIFAYQIQNPYMESLYSPDTYMIVKKANYMERLTCSFIATDNIFKIYDWNEKNV